jgi:hypothetical protein
MMRSLAKLSRYVACGRVTKRPIFEFVSSAIHPNDALMVFPFEDDYSFGVLQSGVHWAWFVQRCSTLKGDFRYTSNTVFDTFPWPQSPSQAAVRAVADAAVALRVLRWELRAEHKLSLRDLYRAIEKPGKHPLIAAHKALDAAVRDAYGFTRAEDLVGALAKLNGLCAMRESSGDLIQGPGLPTSVKSVKSFTTDDCVHM